MPTTGTHDATHDADGGAQGGAHGHQAVAAGGARRPPAPPATAPAATPYGRPAGRAAEAGRQRALRDVAVAARALATVAGGGLAPARALTLVASRTANPRLAAALRDVQAEVALGARLSEALGRHPALFGPLHVAVIRAGEFAGTGRRALADAAELLERQVARRDRARAAVTQPLTAFALVAGVVAVAAVPLAGAFGHAYNTLDTLPPPTRALLAAVGWLGRFGLPLTAGSLPAALLLRRWLRTPAGRRRADTLRLRVPVLGPLERAAALAHGARAAAALLRANMPHDQALALAAEGTGNAGVAAALRAAAAAAAAGGSAAVTLHARGLLAPEPARLLTAGERSGGLDGAYAALADHLDAAVEAATDGLAQRLGPSLVGTIIALVAAVLITLYLPVAALLPWP